MNSVSQNSTMNQVPQSSTMNQVPQSSTMNQVPQSSTMNQVPQSSTMNQVPQSSTMNQVPQSSTMNQVPQSSTMNQVSQNSPGKMDNCTSLLESEVDKIQTFVFFDLETSGLSGPDCRILELSMVAVSREELLNMKNTPRDTDANSMRRESTQKSTNTSPVPKLPRVMHKYSRLYYPRRIILPIIEEITGLSNDLLHRLPGFSSSSAEALNLFLDLPKPVTLVAHNGDRYDYPLLMAELDNVLDNVYDLKCFRELQCSDSLIAFRKIDADLKIEQEVKDITEITSLAASFSFENMDDEEIMDLEPERKKVCCKENGDRGEVSRRVSTPPSPGDEGQLEIDLEPPVTPMKDQCIIVNTPKTPMKAKITPKPPITPETNAHTTKVNGTNNVRRNLTYGVKKRKWDGTQPFKQVNVYKRLFGGEYDAHRAEADCIALLEICGFYSENFVNWADNNCFKFTTVKPMWGRRKTFQIK